MVSVAPGVSRRDLLPKLRRLSPLRHHMRAMLVAAAVLMLQDEGKLKVTEYQAK